MKQRKIIPNDKIENRIILFLNEKYCFKIIISLLLLNLQFKKKLAIITKKGIKGLIKLGNTNSVVFITSNNCVVIECCSSIILKICESQINPIKIIMFIEIYFK